MARDIESVKPAEDGARYIDGDERDGYVDRPLKLIRVNHEPVARFGPRWLVTGAMLDSGELVRIALADNPTRAAMFSQVREDLLADGADAYAPVCLYRQERSGGNAFWTFRSATDEELAAAQAAEAIPADEEDEPAPKAKGK